MIIYVITSVFLLLYLGDLVLGIILVVTLIIAFYFYYWRARPNYGSNRNLPTGSLQLAPTRPWVDYLFYKKQATKYGAIMKMNHFVRPMICITGFEYAADLLNRFDDKLGTPPMPFNRYVPGGFMRYMAPNTHAQFRSKLGPVFSAKFFLTESEAYAGDIFAKTFQHMINDSVVNPAPYFGEMVFAILVKLFVGINHGDSEYQRLKDLYRAIDYRRALFTTKTSIERSLDEIETIFQVQIQSNRECYLTEFYKQVFSKNQHVWDEKAVLRNFIYLLQTSSIDIADLITWIFKKLCDHPGYVSMVQQALSNGDDSALLSARHIVLETLRMEQSEYLMRHALTDIEFNGYTIPKGWLVRIGVRESHLDCNTFQKPEEFNPDRFLKGTENFNPLGIGDKSCLGKGLTVWVGQKFVTALVKKYRCQVIEDGTRELGVFHWRPSSKLRVKLIKIK